jgi:hypothetical protein
MKKHFMTDDLADAYRSEVLRQLRGYKRLAEEAIAQVTDDELFATLDAEANSIAVTMKHMVGNMRSRFTSFLTSDGEKPDRHRDQEFVITAESTRAEIMPRWSEGWQLVLSTIEALQPGDMMRTVTIRQEPHSVMQALNRQLAHYAYHVGQIVFLAKHFRSSEWKSLSIPRGKSEEFTRNPPPDRGTRA